MPCYSEHISYNFADDPVLMNNDIINCVDPVLMNDKIIDCAASSEYSGAYVCSQAHDGRYYD